MTDTHKLEELSWPAVEQYITGRGGFMKLQHQM
ncbi:hypothetical protein SAMN06266787_1267 [Halorubrum ezzemoulense]|jgi:hypothetical protein|uniref:Uncharacterized protein n=1 Tax=Halorubrum ezzemoulense TaxID=337243 RepID=A0A238Z3P0_HALEZ|nr:hypothetical protein SAMN06266787_1267 [Halorubrum ezzemoulense]